MNAAMDLIDAARHTFFRHPLVNNERHWKRNWGRYEKSAARDLGTVRQALATLTQLVSLTGEKLSADLSNSSLYTVVQSLTQPLRAIQEDRGPHSIVGDPKDVAFIIPPALHIGFAVSRNMTGSFTHELIEGRYYVLEVLRKNAKIIAIRWRHVARMESYGNRHVM